MEYVAGHTLPACADSDGALPLPLAAGLGTLLAEGLSAVHAAGWLHRDLKPQNDTLGDDGPMIINFGLDQRAQADAPMATRTRRVLHPGAGRRSRRGGGASVSPRSAGVLRTGSA
ncbi:hypothetical protein EAO74_03010 [Streptomyces sp. gb1(2016)]|uniref:Protein kinase domain-containing protein n=1 Tax=Streptomyces sp. gb1(2016) TaxID=1828321 RepID=A0A652LB82_9ACTN|nr:hypothetical protein EAO74_03010 [Streptomyces sp. gb1(2016)]